MRKGKFQDILILRVSGGGTSKAGMGALAPLIILAEPYTYKGGSPPAEAWAG
jgi:hypothetical protein